MVGKAAPGFSSTTTITGGPSRSLLANPAITQFRRALEDGTHWYLALLDAIALWEEPRERFRGQDWQYLIAGEALDWLLLADRLCKEVRPHLPRPEVDALLFEGRPPLPLATEEFRDRIGPLKYRCFLNYFYGVTVEQALFFALEEEGRRHVVTTGGRFDFDPLHLDLYGAREETLLEEFARETRRADPAALDVRHYDAYTYFLFKHRIAYCLPPRVASDTKRGLAELRKQYTAARRPIAFAGRPDGFLDGQELDLMTRTATA